MLCDNEYDKVSKHREASDHLINFSFLYIFERVNKAFACIPNQLFS